MLLAVLALAIPATAVPVDESRRGELINEIESSRIAFLQRSEPVPAMTERYQPRLNDIRTAAFAAASASELGEVTKALRVWKEEVMLLRFSA